MLVHLTATVNLLQLLEIDFSLSYFNHLINFHAADILRFWSLYYLFGFSCVRYDIIVLIFSPGGGTSNLCWGLSKRDLQLHCSGVHMLALVFDLLVPYPGYTDASPFLIGLLITAFARAALKMHLKSAHNIEDHIKRCNRLLTLHMSAQRQNTGRMCSLMSSPFAVGHNSKREIPAVFSNHNSCLLLFEQLCRMQAII